ncbi:MAG: glycosyltransferase [Epsilonproteobacteria bacterium]|nr:glycosyltransferase [Campylobacterota bacterium]
MKILIIANSTIFGRELKEALEELSVDVLLLDFASLMIYTKSEKFEKYSDKFGRYQKIPKLSMLFRLWFIRKVIKELQCDIVNIHYSRWLYLMILNSLKSTKFVMTFYGSDFYRTSNRVKKMQRKLYKAADAITFTNPRTKASFLDYYQAFDKKSHVCRFGLSTLDFIDKNRDKSKKEMQKNLGYDSHKVIVTCGYNATKAQQHAQMIENLVKLDKKILANCQFIFPLTYGDSSNREVVKQRLAQTTLDYIVLEHFLYEDENAYIKLASDVMINILETDSFSGSMQEFLYAGNIVITGRWLPYELFEEKGIEFYKIDHPSALSEKIEEIYDNVPMLKSNLSKNREIIHNLSHWNNTISSWIKVYQSIQGKER